MLLPAIQGVISGSSQVPPDLLAKLESWWECEETGTSATRVDALGNHDIGSVTDGTTDTIGKIGNGLLFDGNSQAQTTPSGWPSGTGSFAFMCWVNPTVRSAFDFLVWRCESTSTGAYVPGDWDVGITSDNNCHFRISFDGSYNDGDGDFVITTGGVFTAGVTHWVYAHYNSINGEMAISVDNGALVTHTLSHTFFTNGNCLRFGRLTSSYPNGLQGWMDEMIYANEPLTDEERTWLWNDGAGRSRVELTG